MYIFGVECLINVFNCEFLLISYLFFECFPLLYPNLENDALLCFEMSAACTILYRKLQDGSFREFLVFTHVLYAFYRC